MKKFLFLFCFLPLLLPLSAQAVNPHENGGVCCDPGFTYAASTCINNNVPTFCASVSAGVTSVLISGAAMQTVCNLAPNACQTLVTTIANPITNSCVNYVGTVGSISAAVMCVNFAQPIETALRGLPLGGSLNVILNEFQTGCQIIVNNFLGSAGSLPIPPYQLPRCNYGFYCNTGICEFDPSVFDPFIGCSGAVNTAIGCVPYDLSAFITTVLRWGIGLAGGIVMLVLGLAALNIATAGGDAKKVQAGREMIISVIGGIILIVFSVLVLNFIGVQILHIEGLGFNI